MIRIFSRTKKQNDLTDEELIKGSLKNNSVFQARLYDRYAGKMYSICLRYAKDRDEAEDFLQEAFIRIFEKLYQFRFEGSFEGWLKRIVSVTCIEKLRQKNNLSNSFHYNGLELTEIEPYIVSEHYAPDSNLNNEDLRNALNSLPVGYKTIFNLYVIEGFSHAEIAEMLGISEGTSKSQLAHARKALQKILKQELPKAEKKIKNQSQNLNFSLSTLIHSHAT